MKPEIDALHERLTRAGVKQLRFVPISLRQWSVDAEQWGLEMLDGERFMDRHKDDGLAQRMAAVLVIGQLGALEVLPNSRFAPGNRALAAARACPASASLPRPAPRAISHTIPAHWKTGTGMAHIAHLLG